MRPSKCIQDELWTTLKRSSCSEFHTASCRRTAFQTGLILSRRVRLFCICCHHERKGTSPSKTWISSAIPGHSKTSEVSSKIQRSSRFLRRFWTTSCIASRKERWGRKMQKFFLPSACWTWIRTSRHHLQRPTSSRALWLTDSSKL